jgi:TonB family protein
MRPHFKICCASLAALSLVLTLTASAARASAQCTKGTTHEQILRSRAVNAIMPTFPPGALKDKAQGVAVAQVELNEEGEVIAVKILQASHPAIERAMFDAIIRWRFKPFMISGKAGCIQGKLTFYFIINQDGVGIVKNPKVYS